ncbi:MAG: ester cyclase [Chloroflexi bacterium]|nr:ester cyclase [Acidobacteriota bacterium]MCA1587956.1 ester cyclase [Chloroflexota bacterium]MCA1719565.1 ester cyclase [Actinomycetota bacterium]
MTSTQQQDKFQVELESAASRLRALLEIDLSTDDIVRVVRDARQIEENKKVLLRFQREVFNASDWSMETLRRNLTEDFVDHAAMEGDPPGFEGVQMRFSAWASAFEDPIEDNIAIIGEGDLLGVMYNLHAQHNGPFMGIPPTNREVVIPGMEVVRIRDGKIAEHWGIYDFLRTAEEIGSNLAFLPRDGEAADGDPQRPVVPWAVKLTEDDAEKVGEDAEKYLRPGT